ncbi:hypothetical protein BJ875DRAFT_202196 [Amylocarpus encephaloides]|uniref:Vacuolar ATPase assembly protein VMA22 n=1 Tax=Amylocarpus encephaloides TaxID=45428 RepID=A0A9P8C815_9HELO|nr:hypothetical protein BJ875DRAFT_202196 [Amylocarpus encephaloides]
MNDTTAQIILLSEKIDRLLEVYLQLLHEYEEARNQAVNAQSQISQSIARANFEGKPLLPYGETYYDERMRALRGCRLVGDEDRDRDAAGMTGKEWEISEFPATTEEEAEDMADAVEKLSVQTEGDKQGNGKEQQEKREENAKPAKVNSNSPLRWYGLLTPRPLKDAQATAIRLLEGPLPRLATIDGRMKDLEIEIRRTRKYRAKEQAKVEAGKENPKTVKDSLVSEVAVV